MTFARFDRRPASLLDTFFAARAPASERRAAGDEIAAAGLQPDVLLRLRSRSVVPWDASAELDSATVEDDLARTAGPGARDAEVAAAAAAALGEAVRTGDGTAAYRFAYRIARHDPDRDRAARLVTQVRGAMDAGALPGPRGAMWAATLAEFGDRFRDDLLAWHRDGDRFARHCAGTAFASAGAWAVPHLFEALDDHDDFVADGAMYHFGNARAHAPLLVEGLAHRIVHAPLGARRRPAVAAGRVGPAAAGVVPALRRGAADTGIGIALSCRHALFLILGEVTSDTIRKVVQGLDADDFEATQAVQALGEHAAPAFDTIVESLPRQIPSIRADLCDAIGRMRGAVNPGELHDVLRGVLVGQHTANDAERDDPAASVRHASSPTQPDESDVGAAARAAAELGDRDLLPLVVRVRDRLADASDRGSAEVGWLAARAAAHLTA